MEFLRIIGILMLVTLCSCVKHKLPPSPEEDMLYRVECLYQMKPDSALLVLDNLNLTALSEKERAHYCLLRANAAYQIN